MMLYVELIHFQKVEGWGVGGIQFPSFLLAFFLEQRSLGVCSKGKDTCFTFDICLCWGFMAQLTHWDHAEHLRFYGPVNPLGSCWALEVLWPSQSIGIMLSAWGFMAQSTHWDHVEHLRSYGPVNPLWSCWALEALWPSQPIVIMLSTWGFMAQSTHWDHVERLRFYGPVNPLGSCWVLEVLWPSQPIGIMLSIVSLPSHS